MPKLQAHHIDDIIALFNANTSVKAIKELLGFSNSEWREGMRNFPDLREEMKIARLDRIDEDVQAMHAVARDETLDVNRAKLIIDTIKWEASKLIPHVYGDKLAVEVKTIDIRDGLKAAEQRVIDGIIERRLIEAKENEEWDAAINASHQQDQ